MRHTIKKSSIIKLLGFASLLLVVGSISYGIRLMDKPRQRPEKAMKYLTKKLDLSSDQTVKVNSFFEKMKWEEAQLSSLRGQIKHEISSELKKDNFDKNRIISLLDRQLSSFENSKIQMVDDIAELHQLLTKEQRIVLDELLQNKDLRKHNK